MNKKNYVMEPEDDLVVATEDDFVEEPEAPLTKNRETSRQRHHCKEKAKKKAKNTLDIVEAKAGRLSDKATADQSFRAEKKVKNTEKKVHQKNNQ